MGFFSWIDVRGNQNIVMEDNAVILLLPKDKAQKTADFFGFTLSEYPALGLRGSYNGYGCISGVDIYEVEVFINACLTNDEEFNSLIQMVKESDSPICTPEEAVTYLAGVRRAYNEGLLTTVDRDYGIVFACSDEDNARCPYPIKLAVDDGDYYLKFTTYENSSFSMGDPEQGFYKLSMDKTVCENYGSLDNVDERSFEDIVKILQDEDERRTNILEELKENR